MNAEKTHRSTIHLEDATVLSHQACAGDQFILRVQAPACASTATAGQFAHIRCEPMLAMRRPLSIMRVNAIQGWVEFLYKIVGDGLRPHICVVEGGIAVQPRRYW